MPRCTQRSATPVDAFVSHFDAQVHEVPAHRRDFVDWMHGADVDDDTVDDLGVVFSEVAANAVAASPDTSDDVRVRAQLDDDDVLVLEISNRAERPGHSAAPPPEQDDPLRQRGRGLVIARAYLDSLCMEPLLPDRFIVRCRRRISPHGAA
jgi:anti-sigma regulatory factor (Ser/Thr protein kinase)